MNIGSLKKRITFQSMTKTADGMGGYNEVSKDEMTVWAAIWPISASERLQASQQVMTISHRIRMRYRSGLSPSWRVNFGSRYFAIVSIVNLNEAERTIDLFVKEAV